MTNFTVFDWTLVVLYVIGAAAAGWYGRRYIHDMADFVVAGRKLNVFIAIATLSGTEMGLVTVMYMAEMGYTKGFSAMVLGLIWFCSMMFIGLTGFIVREFRRSGAMTIAEYYEQRYTRGVRWLGGVVIAAGGILNMGAFLKMGAIFMTDVTGIPASIHLPGIGSAPTVNVVMTVMLTVVLFYTLLGGMVSVVVTDYVQFVVLSLGIGLTTACVFWRVGLGRIAEAVVSTHGIAGLSPFRNPDMGWFYVAWNVLVAVAANALWQTATLRVSAARDEKTVLRMYRWSSLTWLGRAVIPMLWGCAALALFGNSVQDTPHAMPRMLAHVVPAGVIGILVAGMLAAFMSTHDSYLLAWSSVLTQDVVAPLFKDRLSTRVRLALTRVFILLIGAFLLVFGLWYEFKGDVWGFLATTGTMYLSGALALLVGGIYWRHANTTGAYAAIAAGVCLPAMQLLGKQLHWFTLAEGVAGLGAFALAGVGMVAGSLYGASREGE